MEPIKIGYCREIFNPDKPVRMNSSKTGETIFNDICVTAVYLEQGQTKAMIVGMDVRNVYGYFSEQVRPMITEVTGVPTENIFLHTPHNHSSPDCSAQNDPTVADWRERIGYPAIVRAAKNACEDAKVMTGMEGGEGVSERVSFVRRYLMADGNWSAIGNKSKVTKIAHESDADLLLRAVRITREGGKDIILVSYQTHAASGLGERPTEIHSDFVGPLRDRLEEKTGGLVLYLQGACGNTNCATRIAAEKPFKKDTTGVGQSLADTAFQVLKTAKPMNWEQLKVLTGTLECRVNHSTDHLADKCREIYDEDDLDKRQEMADALGICLFAEPGIIIRRAGLPDTEQMPLATLAIGDLGFGFFPFEMFDTNGKQLRDISAYPMTFPCGYSLNYLGYMPSCTAVPHGGYEVFMCRYVPGTGESVVLELVAMLRKMKNS